MPPQNGCGNPLWLTLKTRMIIFSASGALKRAAALCPSTVKKGRNMRSGSFYPSMRLYAAISIILILTPHMRSSGSCASSSAGLATVGRPPKNPSEPHGDCLPRGARSILKRPRNLQCDPQIASGYCNPHCDQSVSNS